MYIKRLLENDITQGARFFPVIAIVGPRQSGKTTLAKNLFNQHPYVSLEDLDKRKAALEDPRSFLLLHQNEHGLIIDEFQYAPDLLSYIQTRVDAEQRPGFFILTGSQNFLMSRSISQSLAGRVSLHTLLPFSVQELQSHSLLPQSVETILHDGLYPAVYTKNIPANRLYSQYIKTYVERDVRQLTHVGDLTTFQIFIKMCAERVGQLVNFSEFSRECRISDQTVRRWLTILQASYIIFLLPPYEKTLTKRLVKSPKLYFYDTGLVCSLLGIDQEMLGTHQKRGNIFESFVISEIAKNFYNQGFEPPIYFWQDRGKHEVDCVIDYKNTLTALEIKASRTVNTSFFAGLSEWEKSLKDSKSINSFVIYGGSADFVTGYKNVVSWQLLASILPGGLDFADNVKS